MYLDVCCGWAHVLHILVFLVVFIVFGTRVACPRGWHRQYPGFLPRWNTANCLALTLLFLGAIRPKIHVRPWPDTSRGSEAQRDACLNSADLLTLLTMTTWPGVKWWNILTRQHSFKIKNILTRSDTNMVSQRNGTCRGISIPLSSKWNICK